MPEPSLRLFFALRPPPDTAQRIAEAVAALSRARRARWLKAANYHITVHFLGDHAGDFPPGLLDCARRAADAVRVAPLDIVLDRLDCFRSRDQAPLVLRPDLPSEAALQNFWQRLGLELRRNGQRHHVERSFTPHLTIGYGAPLQQPAPIAPVEWAATNFELIVSHAGEARHESLAKWPMRI